MTALTLTRILNTFAYILFLSSDVYTLAVGPPDGTTEPYAKHLTYLTPAPWVIGVWGIIHLLLAGFIVWQWVSPDSDEILGQGFGNYFVVAALCSSMWGSLWASNHFILSFILLCFASAAVTLIYHALTVLPPRSLTQFFFLHAPISMYHAWLVFLTWLNFMAILTRKEHWEQLKEAKLWEQLLVAFVLAQLVATAVAYTEFKGELGDVLGAFTIAWSLLGVAAYQPEPFIHYASFASAVVIMAYAFRPHVIQRRVAFVALGDESLGEREPLVGAERV